jgi:RNA polymerase sigma-70 factor, ECF subfamily
MQEESLNQLLADIRTGKPEAFDRFLTLVQNTVFSFGMKVCGEVEDARDTMQDTLLKAFRSLPETDLTDAAALKVWLYKVAKNACLMMRRKGKFEPRTLQSLEDLLPRDHAAVADWSTLPVDELIKSELEQTVKAAIAKLPASHRIVLILRDMEQLSTKETAEVLEITTETVKMRLHRARLFLRKELEKALYRNKDETLANPM